MDWERLPVRVTSEATDWPERSRTAAAGGGQRLRLSGTNAHVVVEGYDASANGATQCPLGFGKIGSCIAVGAFADLSPVEEELHARGARSCRCRGSRVGRSRNWRSGTCHGLTGMSKCCPRKTRRPILCSRTWRGQRAWGGRIFAHRAGVVFHDAESLRKRLKALAETDQEPAHPAAGKVAFAYTGEASQWIGMGEVLYESEPWCGLCWIAATVCASARTGRLVARCDVRPIGFRGGSGRP